MNRGAAAACLPEAFEERYRADPDPWRFASAEYERERYRITLSALTRDRYGSAFEPGCSIGELTALLAPRCDRLLATDVSQTAVQRARQRCSEFGNVRIRCGDLRTPELETPLDLVVLSEMAYYFDAQKLETIAQGLAGALQENGTLLAAHWLGESPDHVLHGDEVHEILIRTLRLRHIKTERHPGFRLDMWIRACTK